MIKVTGQALRDELRLQRRNISRQQRDQLDHAIQQHLSTLIQLNTAKSLAVYWPFDGEPDITPICGQLYEDGVEIALPRIAESGNEMTFHSWQPQQVLEPNRFGVPEPQNSDQVSLSRFEILAVPLVGYDQLGNRIGMGSGFYDRHLESIRNSASPLRVGIAYSLQEVELVNHNDWDIPLHGVINENGWLDFRKVQDKTGHL